MKVRITKVPDKALNAAKWNHKHADGGPLEYDFSQGFLYPAPDSLATNLRAASVPVQETVQTPAPIDYDELKRRQYYLESKFNDKAVNRHSGAMGAYQIMPITLKDYTQRTGETGDLNDYAFNEKVRDYYMNRHLNSSWATKNNQSEYNRVAKALAAYNWGPGNLLNYLNGQKASGVDIYQGTDWIKGLPGETRNYISWILDGKDIGNRTTNAGYEKAKKRRFDFGGYIGQDKENLFAGGGDEEIAVVTPDYYPGTYLYDPANRPAYAQQSVVEQPVESFVVDVPSSRPVQPRLSAPRQRLANVEKYAPHTVVSSPVAGASGTLLYNPEQQTYDTIAAAEKNLGASDRKAVNTVLSGLKTKEDIENFQRMLVDAGYDLGTYGVNKDGVDGKLGKKTRLAAEKYFSEKNKENIPETVVRDEPLYADPVDIYNTITPLQRISSMAFTVLPSHTGAYLNKSRNERLGKRLGIDNYDALLADNYINAENEYLKAQKNGTQEEKLIAYTKFNDAKKAIPTNKLNRKGLSKAEKLSALAILTGINGGKQMTYDDYVNNISKIGGTPGDNYLGTNSRHKNKKTGKDTFLYNGLGGYDIMNLVEDSTGYEKLADDGAGIVPSVIRAEQRIYNDPNRGRLGGFSYKVEPDGSIVIRDKLSAPEATPAKGKNDDAKYTAARKFFPRASTADIVETISAKEYRRIMEQANKKKSKSNK